MMPKTSRMASVIDHAPPWIAAVACTWFLVSASVIQAIHFQHAASIPISAYLRGAGSLWMQGAYYGLGVGLIMLALYFGKRRSKADAATALILVLAAIAVVLVAYSASPWPLPAAPGAASREKIHILSAFVAFLCVTLAMFVESALLWRGQSRKIALVYASAVLALELMATLATRYARPVYGALEKLSVAGLVLWLLAAALTGFGSSLGE